MPMHPQVIIDLNANHSYLIAHYLYLVCLVIDFLLCSSATIHACKQIGCHIVTLEGNSAIFNVILSPLDVEIPLLTCGSVLHTISLVDEDKPIWKVAKRSHISK